MATSASSYFVSILLTDNGAAASKLTEPECAEIATRNKRVVAYDLKWVPSVGVVLGERAGGGTATERVVDATRWAWLPRYVVPLLKIGGPFHFVLWLPDPVEAWCDFVTHVDGGVLDVHVAVEAFEFQWASRHCVSGERHVAHLLREGFDRHLLFVSTLHEPSPARARRTPPKRKRSESQEGGDGDGEEGGNAGAPPRTGRRPSQNEALEWMSCVEARVHRGVNHVDYAAAFIEVPATRVVFCTSQFVFVERSEYASNRRVQVQVNGGLIVGERNAGKSLVVRDLVYGDRGVRVPDTAAAADVAPVPASEPEPRRRRLPLHATPGYHQVVAATLIVVPAVTIHQWAQYFSHDPTLVCVYNAKTLRACTREKIERANVVLVTHPMFLSTHDHEDDLRSKIMARVVKYTAGGAAADGSVASTPTTSTTPSADTSGVVIRLDWYYWARVIVDEVFLFTAEHLRRKRYRPRTSEERAFGAASRRDGRFPRDLPFFHTHLWWGLQGGVSSRDSTALDALVEVLCGGRGPDSPLRGVRNLINLDTFRRTCIYAAPALADLTPPLWLDRTVFDDLTSHERQVYDTLLHVGAEPAELRRVCVGDLAYMNTYMTTVENWSSAIPLGIEAINRCLVFNEEDFYDEDEDDEYEEGSTDEDEGDAEAADSDYVQHDDEDDEDDDDEGPGTRGFTRPHRSRPRGRIIVHTRFVPAAPAPTPSDTPPAAPETLPAVPVAPASVASSFVAPAPAPAPVASSFSPAAVAPRSSTLVTAAEAIARDPHGELAVFFTTLTKEIGERRDFFVKTSNELSSTELHPAVCAVCLVNVCDCIFVCGHMLCHVCVLDLFNSARVNNETHELPELLVPCPTCRWNLEPGEVFWVLNRPVPLPSRFCSLVRVVEARPQTTVVFGACARVLRAFHRRLTGTHRKWNSKLLASPAQPCATNVHWEIPGVGGPRCARPRPASRVLFVPFYKTFGLKLHGVSTAVFIHRVTGTREEKDILERLALSCIIQTTPPPESSHPFSVYRFIALNTLEHEVTT
jgi:hypothetical protein